MGCDHGLLDFLQVLNVRQKQQKRKWVRVGLGGSSMILKIPIMSVTPGKESDAQEEQKMIKLKQRRQLALSCRSSDGDRR